jgi:hypothetical protein
MLADSGAGGRVSVTRSVSGSRPATATRAWRTFA